MKRIPWVMSGVAGMLIGHALPSHAAGFALIEQNASGMGNAFAGAAATAEDASTIFFNPAGMTYLPDNQLVVAAHAIKPSADFSDDNSAAPFLRPLGNEGGDAGGWAFVPNFYFSKAVNDDIRLGIGLNAPFGLATEYSNGWVGRFQALRSEIKTVNVNPAVSFRVNDMLSLGIGANWQRIDAELTSATNFVASEGRTRLEADDHAWGWNAGAIFNLSSDTRIGMSYRSEIDYRLSGTVHVTTATGATFLKAPVRAGVTLPDTYSISLSHHISPQWELLADYTRTQWGDIQSIDVKHARTGATLDKLNLNFDNTYRISLGANYVCNDRVKLRVGVAYDQSPVEDKTRTARLPDNDRIWLAVGAGYKFSPESRLDLGYAHLFMQDGSISDTRGTGVAARGNLSGDYENSVDILSLQFTHSF